MINDDDANAHENETPVSALAVAAIALLMTTLLFNETPVLVVTASPAPQHHQNVPTPPGLRLSSNVPSSIKTTATGRWKSLGGDGPSRLDRSPVHVIAAPQPNCHVPTPSHPFYFHSSVQKSAAGQLATCTPSPQCNGHVPTPECCNQESKEEQQVVVNRKAGLMRDYYTSMNTAK